MLEGGHADLDRLLRLVAHIDLAGRVLAHQHHGEPWDEAMLLLEGGDLGGEAAAQALGERLAVDDIAHARLLPSMSNVSVGPRHAALKSWRHRSFRHGASANPSARPPMPSGRP